MSKTHKRARSLFSRRAATPSAAPVPAGLTGPLGQAGFIEAGPNPAPAMSLLDRLSSADRKLHPMAAGLLDYFPDALAAVSNVSWEGNNKHNPGQPLHHARGKSNDHADCILRHLAQRGGFDGNIRHSAALAWRALALLQEELENEMGLPLPRGAR